MASSWNMYMLLHLCKCNIRFTSTEPEGYRSKGEVLVNRILHKQGCNKLTNLCHTWNYMVYTLCMLRSNVTTKMEESNHVSEDPCNQPSKRKLFLAFFEEKTESSWEQGWWMIWFCIKRGAGRFVRQKACGALYQTSKRFTCTQCTLAELLHW